MNLLQTLNAHKLRTATLAVAATLLATIIAPTGLVLAQELTPSADGNATVSTSEVANALRDTTGVLESSDQIKTISDADSAIQAVTAGASVDIPKDASDGVTLASTDGTKPAIDISLPNADNAGDAKQVAAGTVAYPANNGSASAVQATEDGGVRMLTVIDNPNAPTEYDYRITVPSGGQVVLSSDGGAVVLDSQSQVLSMVATPWAKDANGLPVETYFTTDGRTLVQHVQHNVAGVAYPVTADPSFSWSWSGVTIYLSKSETRYASGVSFAALAGFVGISGWGGAAIAAVGYTADYAIQNGNYCLAIYRPYVYFMSGWAWIYRC